MIPVKNSAGGTAFIFHNESERTPYKNTDEIANIKSYREHKKPYFIDHIEMIKDTEHSD